MNQKERFLCVLRGEVPDVTPWLADLSYLYQSMKQKGTLDPKYDKDEGYVAFHRDMDTGMCFFPPYLWKTSFDGGISTHLVEKNGQRVHQYNTPKGSVRMVEQAIAHSYTVAIVEHYIKSMDDLAVMTYIAKHTRYEPDEREYRRVEKLWNGYGYPVAFAPVSVAPLQKLLARWAGIDQVVSLYMEDEQRFSAYLHEMETADDPAFAILADADVDYVEFAENLSSEITGVHFFDVYNRPYYQRRIRQLHARGKKVGIHIDGTLKGCLERLQPCGFDVAESITPYPVGDIPIDQLQKVAGDAIILWGGLPGAIFSPVYEEAVFDQYLNELHKHFPRGSRFILGVADQVPPDALIDRVKKVQPFLNQMAQSSG